MTSELARGSAEHLALRPGQGARACPPAAPNTWRSAGRQTRTHSRIKFRFLFFPFQKLQKPKSIYARICVNPLFTFENRQTNLSIYARICVHSEHARSEWRSAGQRPEGVPATNGFTTETRRACGEVHAHVYTKTWMLGSRVLLGKSPIPA